MRASATKRLSRLYRYALKSSHERCDAPYATHDAAQSGG